MRLVVRLLMPPVRFLVFLVLPVLFVLAVSTVAVLVGATRGVAVLVRFVLAPWVALRLGLRLLAQARDRLFERLETVRDPLELAPNGGVRP